jgi:RNA polymerase sigma-70 factor (ECF subfamily)
MQKVHIDHFAFSQMYHKFYHKIFGFVSMRVNNFDDATDVVQDVFLTAYRTWQVMPDEKTAKNFLFIIARSKMIDFWRKAHNKHEIKNMDAFLGEDDESFWDNIADENPIPEEIFQQNHNKNEAIKMLEVLNESEREIVTLKYIEELSYTEISEILKITEENARQKVSRAIKKIKEKVSKKVEEN